MEILGVTKSAVEYLREKIITGELRPGQKLNEAELSSTLGISRPPLREAFRTLDELQLVVSIPRKGCVVAEISVEAFTDLYQAREMIECYAIDLLKEKGVTELPRAEAALKATHHLSLPPAEDQRKKLDYLNAFAEFHYRLVESAGNRQLAYFYKTIGFSLARYQFMYVYIPGLTRDSRADHTKLLDLIRKSRYPEAKEFLRNHIHSFVGLVKSKMKADKDSLRAASAL